MSSRKKLVKATLIAPLIAPCLYFSGLLLFELTDTRHDIDLMLFFDSVVLFATPVSYGGMLLLGLPYFAILRKYESDTVFNLTSGGLILGIIVFFVALLSEDIMDIGSLLTYGKFYEQIFLVCIGATLGGSVAFCFAKMRS